MSDLQKVGKSKNTKNNSTKHDDYGAFSIYTLSQSTTLMLYLERDKICSNPTYQRYSDIWSTNKKQLLIDSILNGFDIPKLYFIEDPSDDNCKQDRYAVIDGKQRLEAIWGFMDGDFPLADDFVYREDPDVEARGLSYNELAQKYPRLKARFDSHGLSVVVVKTNDIEVLEEMFSRLNEGEPLSAAEKRNAMGGPIPPLVRELAKHKYFKSRVSFKDKRGRYWEVATKYLFFEDRGGIADTKRDYLDKFVQRWKERERNQQSEAQNAARGLYKNASGVLDRMHGIFYKDDPLLRSVGMAVLYYLLVREGGSRSKEITREKLASFEDKRKSNRQAAKEDVTKAEWELLEFDRLSQSLNDASALKFRLEVLSRYVLGEEVNAKIVDPVKGGDAAWAGGDTE